ncbi:HET-domain-containing protein, partial [Alternaria alternata]
MRLLNTSTLQVEEFLQSQVPDYVILSHTWGSEEVTLQDILSNVAPSKKGFAKLIGCCKRAKDDGFKYCWIDTCCIDKTSSAELSEAINSMYQWYKGACICYAYLEDVQGNPQLDDYKAFSKSRWFTRGWTLQELIAPGIVEFYNVSWVDIGTRSSLQKRLTGITGINEKILTGGNPLNCPVAVRMSWAARRETSRVEDQAYCLLGIFGVNMALLYGEGHRAFLRLQEEILRIDEDYTLFAWDVNSSTGSLLASSPWQFR